MSRSNSAALPTSNTQDSLTCSAVCSPEVVNRWVWGFVALGVVVRLVRYLLKFPLWEDESFLSANLFDHGYAELAGALDYRQVAPVLFMWIQRAFVDLFGFNEYSLRAFSLISGLASVFLFRHLAIRLVAGWPLVLSVALFSVSYPLIRYACEAKPYGSDMLVGLIYLTLFVHWQRDAGRTRYLWALALFAPLSVGLSYPAVFVAGGVSLAVAGTLWSRQPGRGWIAWLAFNLAVAASFLAITQFVAQKQSANDLEFMRSFWKGSFPPLSEPLQIPTWLLSVHTGEMLAYPLGSRRGGSILTFLGVVAALVVLYRARRFGLLTAFAVPLALNLLASALERYPYGGQTRLELFHASWFCLMAGLGWATLAARLVAKPNPDLGFVTPMWGEKFRGPALVACLMAVVGTGIMARDFLKPCKTQSDQRARDFARWFWFEMPHRGEVACVHTDLGQMFNAKLREDLTWTVSYLCNQRIYSPRHARQEPPAWDRVSKEWPLTCALYMPHNMEFDEAKYQAWRAEMLTRYDLAWSDRIPVTRYDPRESTLLGTDIIELLRFVPKQEGTGEYRLTREPAKTERQ